MISQETIDNVFASVKVIDIISQHVQLKRSGKNYKGKCPFHNETDSSFTVSPELNIYTCFGCNKSGNAVNFLMDYKHLSYPQAIKEIAQFYNIDVLEDQSPEDAQISHKRELFFDLYERAAEFFHHNLFREENAIALEYTLSRFSLEQIQQHRIGFATDDWRELLNFLLKHSPADESLLCESKLISHSKGRYFDFFRNRIMFPILNSSNRVISFGGRILPGSDGPKYMNTGNTIIYNKSKTLYLLSHAIKRIRDLDSVCIAEGYTDTIALHANGINNAVAPCGTAFTPEQADMISKYAKTALLIYDGDEAGKKATRETALQLIKAGMLVRVINLPDGLDPYDYFRSDHAKVTPIDSLAEDYLLSRAKEFEKNIQDPSVQYDAIKLLSGFIFHYKDKSLRELYIEKLSKIIKCTKKRFSDELVSLEASFRESSSELDELPDGIDISDYEKYGFYAYNNEYYFRSDKGRAKLSNFVMKPLFHVKSQNDTKRIYQLTNYRGFSQVVDFDMNEMVSLSNFRKNIEGLGNFLFWGMDMHMNKLKLKLYEQTRTCTEIANLGWQKQGFFAWANGIIDSDGSFVPIDRNGLVNINGKDYFIPAFSEIYIEDRSIFLDERKFKYIDRDIILSQWAELFIKVFGNNAKIGIAYWIASVFRDHLLYLFNNFPILNLFGPKGTGKSQMAMSLSCLFGQQQTPFNIHNGTKPGLAEHVQQFINAFAWIDEYKNNIEYDKIETLKSIYDSIGRNRLNMDKGKKKETTLVNSAVILSGQEMPTADVALFSRMIFLQFHQTEYSQEEKNNYDLLKAMEKEGLSHLTSEILKHRKYFVDNFFKSYDQILSSVFSRLEHLGIEDRILRSFCSVLASFKTISSKIDIPLDYDDLEKVAVKAIIDQNNQISSSNEISQFWETIEALFDENIIRDRWHFKIDNSDMLKVRSETKMFNPPINVLKLKFSVIYKLYATHSKRSGQTVLPNTTLKYYLENNPAFLGVEKSSKFTLKEYSSEEGKTIEQHQVTTAYCFNYDKLNINLMRIPSDEKDPWDFINEKSKNQAPAYKDEPF